MKKNLLVVMLFVLSMTACVSEDVEVKTENAEEFSTELLWLKNFEEAQEISKLELRPILVNFTGSDWCGWCIKLDNEVFSQSAFIDYANKNLILLELDFPNKIPQSEEIKKYNRNLATKYGIRGFPTILLLNAEGEVIAKTGYQKGGAEKYIEHLTELLTKDEEEL